MKNKEIKTCALFIPFDEFFDWWMHDDNGKIFREIDMIGLHPSDELGACLLLFEDSEKRKDAYIAIQQAYPLTQCTYFVHPCYIPDTASEA